MYVDMQLVGKSAAAVSAKLFDFAVRGDVLVSHCFATANTARMNPIYIKVI